MTDAANELAHVIRELINRAVVRESSFRDVDRPNLTEQRLFEYLKDTERLPVTRRAIKYAVMRREIVRPASATATTFQSAMDWSGLSPARLPSCGMPGLSCAPRPNRTFNRQRYAMLCEH